MRVATYNIHHGAPARGPVDIDAVAAVCASFDADVVALQEVDRHTARSGGVDQAAVIAERLGADHRVACPLRFDDGGEYGVALVSRRPIERVDVIDLPVRPGGEPRVALVAQLGSVVVVATHLQNPRRGDPTGAEARTQLHVLLDALADVADPVVVAGDLNLGPAAVVPVFAAAGWSVAHGPVTFPSRRPRRRIDWIASRGLVASADGWVPAVTASDHRPLVVDLA